MKRIGNLFQQIASIENLRIANANARKGKLKQYGIKVFDRNAESNLLLLHETLINHTYKTSAYKTFKVFEPKERLVYKLPYYPDRITHHAIMNVLEPIFVRLFTADTYSCIKGRGIHKASYKLREALSDKENTTYCLKLDIKKFYPSVNHETLKELLRRKFKDYELLALLYEIIGSAEGLPIGNYLSPNFANFYLTQFDHWLKQKMKVKRCFRYADDIVILSNDKDYLHDLLNAIKTYLKTELLLEVKQNYQVFPVEARGIDFVGYVHYHTHTLLRKSIKKRFARAIAKGKPRSTTASYLG